jgi:hypothetical protein
MAQEIRKWNTLEKQYVPKLTCFLLGIRKLDQRGEDLFNDPRPLVVMVRKYLQYDSVRDPGQY